METVFAESCRRQIGEYQYLDEHNTFRRPIFDLPDAPYYISFLPLSFRLKNNSKKRKVCLLQKLKFGTDLDNMSRTNEQALIEEAERIVDWVEAFD